MTDEKKVREAFEAWLESCYGRIAIGMDREGKYVRDWVNDLWTGWKARDDLSHASATAEECSVDANDAFTLMRFIFSHFGDVSMSHHLTDEVVAATRRIESMAAKTGNQAAATKPLGWFDTLRVGTNSGHGHAWARPDGMKARCGGPALCSQCARDQAIAAKRGG
ncbi:hypothetical protein FHW84_001773 [Dyella sp. SG562]|uniref:hypothetical protein n=1 Tax=Dyella sp. SG562 TaxID=2587017 RepID=UPI0014246621|nr:hypothetical protein [Dyella sp. SG562]NII73204.1 hypothetical protein [Dyella sp. SG562]